MRGDTLFICFLLDLLEIIPVASEHPNQFRKLLNELWEEIQNTSIPLPLFAAGDARDGEHDDRIVGELQLMP